MDVSELPAVKPEAKIEKSVNRFLGIFSDLFHQPGSPSSEIFGLYSKANLDTFLAGIPEQESGYFKYLAEMINCSHELNYWATQPGSNMENFQKSLSLFQRFYESDFFSYPAVRKAQEIYEKTLRRIHAENKGKIPKSMIEYKPDGLASDWDNRVKGIFLRSGIEWQSETTGSEADLYLTLGKAAGNASFKFAEIMNEKPGLISRLISAIRNRAINPQHQQNNPIPIPAG